MVAKIGSKSTSSMLFLLIFFCTMVRVESKFEFTNINCTTLDKEYMGVECFLKSVNRTYKYMTLRTKFHRFPIKDLKVQIQVLKRLNGYKPFLFDFNFDACKYLRGQRSQLTNFVFDLFSNYSNMDHPCPYKHDIFVEKLPISFMSYMLGIVLPMPEGDYCMHWICTINGLRRLDLRIYAKIY